MELFLTVINIMKIVSETTGLIPRYFDRNVPFENKMQQDLTVARVILMLTMYRKAHACAVILHLIFCNQSGNLNGPGYVIHVITQNDCVAALLFLRLLHTITLIHV